MLSLVLAAALEFTAQDAHLAFENARELVENCTPRDAGTIRGRIAAHRILDAASAVGADVRRDTFRAKTPAGEREFTNLYAEFKGDDEDARWVVLVSHYDTKPGTGCPGANDGASTSGLLIGLANAFSNWQTPKGNLMLVWTDGEECMSSYGPNDGFWGSRRAAEKIADENRQVQAVVCLDMLGDKANAKKTMEEAGVPVIPGSKGEIKTLDEARELAEKIGYPVLIKAAAGGGGRGIRVVNSSDELEAQITAAKQESLNFFSDDAVYLEKFICLI